MEGETGKRPYNSRVLVLRGREGERLLVKKKNAYSGSQRKKFRG